MALFLLKFNGYILFYTLKGNIYIWVTDILPWNLIKGRRLVENYFSHELVVDQIEYNSAKFGQKLFFYYLELNPKNNFCLLDVRISWQFWCVSVLLLLPLIHKIGLLSCCRAEPSRWDCSDFIRTELSKCLENVWRITL